MKKLHEQAEKINQRRWDEIAPNHEKSYKSIKVLRNGGVPLDEIELSEVGIVTGKKMLHLQCHLGTDTLSWARLGAVVTGADFSAASLDIANKLARELGLEARWIHSNIYDLRENLDDSFDIVYTSAGVLCWLKDLNEWAKIIHHFLKPGGFFFLMESHPILHIFDDNEPETLKIKYPYFHSDEPTFWDDDWPDYADGSYVPTNPSYEWTWPLSDILNSLINAGLIIESFKEHNRLFFKMLPMMKETENGWATIPGYEDKLPLMFTLKARPRRRVKE